MPSSFVDMALTPEERKDSMPVAMPSSSGPMYPYNLCISLGDEQLKKLNLDASCGVGDLVYMDCVAKVTAVSKNDTTEGTKNRIELQITGIKVESEEEEAAEEMPRRVKNPYKK